MHDTYGNGSDTCYERGAATAKMEVITKGGDGFYVQNKFLTKLKTDINKPEKLSAFKREQRATMPKCYASAMQVLCKCYASAMQVLCKYYASAMKVLCK